MSETGHISLGLAYFILKDRNYIGETTLAFFRFDNQSKRNYLVPEPNYHNKKNLLEHSLAIEMKKYRYLKIGHY